MTDRRSSTSKENFFYLDPFQNFAMQELHAALARGRALGYVPAMMLPTMGLAVLTELHRIAPRTGIDLLVSLAPLFDPSARPDDETVAASERAYSAFCDEVAAGEEQTGDPEEFDQ